MAIESNLSTVQQFFQASLELDAALEKASVLLDDLAIKTGEVTPLKGLSKQFSSMHGYLSKPRGCMELKTFVGGYGNFTKGLPPSLATELKLKEVSEVFDDIIKNTLKKKEAYDAQYGKKLPVVPKKEPVASRIEKHNKKAKEALARNSKLEAKFKNYPATQAEREALLKQSVPVSAMSDFTAKSAEQIHTVSKNLGSCSVEIACTIGKRSYMEDRFAFQLIDIKANGQKHPAEVFALLDGHGGVEAVKFLESNLIPYLKDKLNRRLEKKELNDEDIFYALKESVAHLHKIIVNNKFPGGSTVVLGFKVNNELYVANVGDSSAFLNRKGEVIPMCIAQKPNFDEKMSPNEYAKQLIAQGAEPRLKRVLLDGKAIDVLEEKELQAFINNEKMFLTISQKVGNDLQLRLGARTTMGPKTLDMARSVGDLNFDRWKKFTPEIFKQTLESDDQLIMHSDGVTASMHAVVNAVMTDKKEGISTQETVANIVQASIPENDNITAMIVTFSKVMNDK